MPRTVKEWIGKTDDTPAPPRVRLRVHDRDGGICQCGCGRKIMPGEKWDTDHRTAIINGGENRESNLQTLLAEHHKVKTRADTREKSRVRRKRAKHLGIKRTSRPLPCGRGSPWKRTMDGKVVRR